MNGTELRSCNVLTVGSVAYRLAGQLAAPGLPDVRQGSHSVVYQLLANSEQAERRALKVFSPHLRHPRLHLAADELGALAALPGLQVCKRSVLSTDHHALAASPELRGAIVMPWVDGPSWEEVVLEQRPLSLAGSLCLARGLADVLASLEQRGMAHCDISGANVMLPTLAAAEGHPVAVVDVEGLFARGLAEPASPLPASDGYVHPDPRPGRWGPDADRFAGAVVLAEMLAWSDSRVPASAWGTSFFDPAELQHDGRRFRLLYWVLRELWGAEVARLFQSAWRSRSVAGCPALADWLAALQALRVPEAPERPAAAWQPVQVELPLAAPPAERAPHARVCARVGDGVRRGVRGRARPVALASLAAVGTAACVLAGAYAYAAKAPTSRPAAQVAVAAARSVAVTAAPTAPTPRPTSTRAPSVDDAWDATQVLVDLAWGDWTTTIDVLDSFVERYPDYPPAREKLYAALVEDARGLITSGNPSGASAALSRALKLAPDRPEAADLLASLTPAPTTLPAPTSAPEPTSPPPPAVVANPTSVPEPTSPSAPTASPAPSSPPPPTSTPQPTPTPVPVQPLQPVLPVPGMPAVPPLEPAQPGQPVRPVQAAPPSSSTQPSAPAQIPTSAQPPVSAPTPTPRPSRADTAAAPEDVVRSFYRLAEQGPSPQAADLWTPRLRALFPPAENITSRFSHTRALVVERADLVALDPTAGRATVAVTLREQLDSPPLERRYQGTWDLVRAPSGWLLDQPDLRLN